jgi:threonine aldolase
MNSVGNLVHHHGMMLHLDGARIFNASVALGTPAAVLVEPADSVMFCLSKGLCAPVGSVLCGSSNFITKSRKIRKQLGGGMRQAGILASAGLVALKSMTHRLGEDHTRARKLAEELKCISNIDFHKGFPLTNMVFIRIEPGSSRNPLEIKDFLRKRGILVGMAGPEHFRLVTHYWINDEDVEKVVAVFKKALA